MRAVVAGGIFRGKSTGAREQTARWNPLSLSRDRLVLHGSSDIPGETREDVLGSILAHRVAMPRSHRLSVLRCGSIAVGASLAIAMAGQVAGCSSGSTPPAEPAAGAGAPGAQDRLGTVGLAVTIPGGETIDTIAWVLTGPNGAPTVVSQGTVDVQRSTIASFQVGGIPAGSGYDIALSATSVEGAVMCAGTASFPILARATTNVTVLLRCGSPAPDAGSVSVGGQTFDCGTVTAVSASPSETAVGSSLSLSGAATGPAPSSLGYAWSASSGTFSAPRSAATSYTCTAPGAVTITLAVSDGPVPAGGACSPLLDTATVTVQCDGALDAGSPDATIDAGAPSACSLGSGGAIKHVIYVQFDNTHLSRDRANVPSDLEQMPHLLGFIRGNGTMMANDHTILISHTAGGILSSLTGVYPDRNGQTVTNSYVRTSAAGAFTFPSAFAYWTDPTAANTAIPNMVGPDGSNIPAPWVSYTRAGCNFGAVGAANMVLENTGTSASGDVTKVFGSESPQFAEATTAAAAAAGTAARSLATTDLVGLAVHCAAGSQVCAAGEADLLPQEPGGYVGFNGLFGAQQINPVLTGQPAPVAVQDLAGNPIADTFGQPGFPGFNAMVASVSLAYIASMQEHGVPVTYAYISDAHDDHGLDGSGQSAYGPGAAGYVQQLAAYDRAFATFFARLAADGIDKTNTLFVFTVDEGDHFVGGAPAPAACDGVDTPCDWTDQLGEVNVNIDTLVSNEFPAVASKFLGAGATDAFTVHGDDAPTFYLARTNGDAGPVGALGQTDPDTRAFERMAARLTAVDPFTGNTDSLLFRMADQTGMKAIHMMTTGDPARNPTFAYFADDDYFITDFPSSTCLTCVQTAFAWNHGDDQSVIGQTWLGFVGPGVQNQADEVIFTDHTDVRPTMNAILGLRDSYAADGRVITQALAPTAYAASLSGNLTTVETLGDAYKQITAPFGAFSDCVLTASTFALQADDATYASVEASIATLTSERDGLVGWIRSALDGAEFGGHPVDATQAQAWIVAAQGLVASCDALDDSLRASDAGAGEAAAADSTSGGARTEAGASETGATDIGAIDATTAGNGDSGGTPPDAARAGAAAGDLVIYRVGDGSSSPLANTGNPVFVDEYTAAGSLVRSTPMPTAPSGANHALVASGVATSEGFITRSTDGRFCVLTGYDVAIPAASSVSGLAAPRSVGRIDAPGNVDTSTDLTDFAVGNDPRSAASTDGVSLWVAGAAGGARFTTLGSTTSAQLSTTVTNLRQVGIFGAQLYVSDSSGSAVRLGTVGSGVPATAGQTITNLPAFPTAGSPYAFFFADIDGVPGVDTLYVADDTNGVPGGVTKYSLSQGSWTAAGTAGAAADAYRGLTGVVSGTTVTLYATRRGGSGATGGGDLVSLVDTSGFGGAFSGTPEVLATAGANTAFRGVALAPNP